ncbi:hypothetical protein ACFSKN_02120 [Mariniflexile gromovii]|uniref:Holin (3TMs family) n=1 Tax=Mariniflexile gromovii TaxID=362523 RepID=A0ABS4BPQ7_9FLAO|nr:hypothetical protein [Mariniflexile gromovii]MBP0902398.1 hypothetical protein [Mariniflexile gromovii]
MPEKKQTYKEIHGTTKVGDFLRSIGKSDLLTKVLGASAELLTGDVKGAVSAILKGSDELTSEQREFALKLLESDVAENEEVSKRWQYDMVSDSWLSKNVRPLLLIYLTLSMSILCVLDSSIIAFQIDKVWIELLENLLLASFFAYFGGRTLEKYKKI